MRREPDGADHLMTSPANNRPAPQWGAMDGVSHEEFVPAFAAALTLGMGVASAQNLSGYGTNYLPSPPYTYSQAGG